MCSGFFSHTVPQGSLCSSALGFLRCACDDTVSNGSERSAQVLFGVSQCKEAAEMSGEFHAGLSWGGGVSGFSVHS